MKNCQKSLIFTNKTFIGEFMLKVLITGGGGFVARNLKELLPSNTYMLDVKSRTELDLLNFSNVEYTLKQNLYDVVIHTANYDAIQGYNHKDPSLIFNNNLKMFFNLERCSRYYEKLICFGSGAEFDRENWKQNMDQSYFDVNVPLDPYGYSKYIITKYILNTTNIYNLRLYSVFGKYEDCNRRFISSACKKIILGEPITINQNAYYDYTDVSDVVKVTNWFIQNSPSNKVFDVCTSRATDLVTIANKLLVISGKNLPIILKKDGILCHYSGNNSLLMSTIPNMTFSNIDESITSLYNWYNTYKQF